MLAMLVVAIAVGVYFYSRMDEEIRIFAEQMLSEKFPQLNVSVGGARLVTDRGIAIYDLSISETSATGRQENLLVMDEVLIVCNLRIANLAQGIPKIKRIVAKRPQLWITREADGRLNIDSLWPLPKCGNQQPPIEIRAAQAAISDRSQPTLEPLVLRDINLAITRPPRPASQELPAPADVGRTVKPVAEPDPGSGRPMVVAGTFSGTHLNGVKLQAKFDLCRQQFSASGVIEQLELTEQLQPWLAWLQERQFSNPSAQDPPARLPQILGIVDGQFQLEYHQAAETPLRFAVSAQLSHGHVTDTRLPRPLTDLSASLQCTNNMLQLSEVHARCGSASVAAAITRKGWHHDAPLALALRVQQLPLDELLRNALPPLLQKQWQKYQPTGQVDAQIQVAFDGSQWFPRATITGRQLAFESDKFHYRLKDGSGTLKLVPQQEENPARLDLDLTGQGGGQSIRIVGQIFTPGPGAAGWVELSGRGLKIETGMIDALPAKARQVITSMHPTGKIDFRWRIDRNRAGQLKPRTTLQLVLADVDLQYEKFSYPLRHIRGLIKAENNNWHFLDLESGGSRQVRCQGSLLPVTTRNAARTSNGPRTRNAVPARHAKPPEYELNLQFSAQQIPLDEDLRKAVPPSVQKAWADLRPRGRTDITAHVHHLPGYARPNIRVTIRPRPESASVRPTFFPYLIEGLAGAITYHEGQLLLSQMRGHHGNTTIRTNGDGTFHPQGDWQFQLVGLSADRVTASRDLILAMPPGLRKVIDQLHPNGDFNLHNGVFRFARGISPLAPVQSHWDFQLAAHQTDLQLGIDLTNVYGSVHLYGSSDGRHTQCAGDLEIDTASFLDVQFTDIRGPLWVDESACLLGRDACLRQQKTPHRLTAKLYDGQLVADARVAFDGRPSYSMEASLTTANLTRMITERFGGQREFGGTLSAVLSLQGSGRSEHTLSGKGEVQIRNANIYELPLLVSLLKVLRSRTPDSTAFNQSDMKFRLQGRHIYLDQIDFLGDAVSLYGKGYTNFDQQLKLIFYGTLGRNDYRIPLIKKFVARTNENIMQMYVDGTLAEPHVQTQAFPGINKLLQQIQMDLDAPPAITQSQPIAQRKQDGMPFGHRR